MKKIFTFSAAALLTASVFAQTPQKMSYQAVIRNSSDQLVTNQSIGMQISILQGSASGTEVYKEIYNPNPSTNTNGLVSIEIGSGIPLTGIFSTIDWSIDTYFIKTETDPAGGTNYSITGTSQILSVPYALHSKTAENLLGGITETDPVFTAWDKSIGISITESQISDLQPYLTSEVDGSVTNELQTLSVSGNSLTISSGNTISLPNRIIRGTINGGFAPTIASGTGFSVSNNGDGTYTIVFNTPFTSTPSATVSLYNTPYHDCSALVYSISTTEVVIRTGLGTGNTSYTNLNNLSFSFIVVE